MSAWNLKVMSKIYVIRCQKESATAALNKSNEGLGCCQKFQPLLGIAPICKYLVSIHKNVRANAIVQQLCNDQSSSSGIVDMQLCQPNMSISDAGSLACKSMQGEFCMHPTSFPSSSCSPVPLLDHVPHHSSG